MLFLLKAVHNDIDAQFPSLSPLPSFPQIPIPNPLPNRSPIWIPIHISSLTSNPMVHSLTIMRKLGDLRGSPDPSKVTPTKRQETPPFWDWYVLRLSPSVSNKYHAVTITFDFCALKCTLNCMSDDRPSNIGESAGFNQHLSSEPGLVIGINATSIFDRTSSTKRRD